MQTQCCTKVQRMVVLSKKGTTWYKSFSNVEEFANWFSKGRNLKTENYILIELPSGKEIILTPQKNLYKLFGKIKKTGVTETIYVIAESEQAAKDECSSFAELVETPIEFSRLGGDWNAIRALFKGEVKINHSTD